jgi:hypothetical protein
MRRYHDPLMLPDASVDPSEDVFGATSWLRPPRGEELLEQGRLTPPTRGHYRLAQFYFEHARSLPAPRSVA